MVRVSNGAGTTIAINRYYEYGIPASTNLGRFQYTGQKWLPTLGLYDFKNRILSPTLGRFLQTDPIGYGDGVNFYSYVKADPVNGTDPTGLEIVIGGNCNKGVSSDIPQLPFDRLGNDISVGDGLGEAIGGGSVSSEIVITANEPKSDQTSQPNDIVVTARVTKRTSKAITTVYQWQSWRGAPYKIGPVFMARTITTPNRSMCGGSVSGSGLAKGAAGGAVGGGVGWLARLGLGALLGLEAGPIGSAAGAALAVAGGAAGGAAKSAFDQACLGE